MNAIEKAQFYEFQQKLSYARTYENGMVYEPTDEKRWVVGRGRPWPKLCCDGTYPYVLLPDGELRFTDKPWPEAKMRHPELCRGGEVIGAGIFVMKNSEVVSISNESGHYAPNMDSLYYVKTAFRFWEAPLAENLVTDGRWEMFSNS